MKSPSNILFLQRQTPFFGLDADQRALVEYVADSPAVPAPVRRRARALVMLDDGEPLADIALLASMPPRGVQALIRRHRESGVRAALLVRSQRKPAANSQLALTAA